MSARKTERDLWSMSGMTIAATSAAVASFSGLRGLASAAGWPEHLAWLLPVTVDAYAMTATRLWLAGRTRHRRARRFAAANALGAIAGSVAGNAIYHALSTGLLAVTWPIVVSVGAVPAAVLGLIAHLHARHTGIEPADVTAPDLLRGPEPDPLPDPEAAGLDGGNVPSLRGADVPEPDAGDSGESGSEDGPESRAGVRTQSRTESGPESGTEDRPESRTPDRPESWAEGQRLAGPTSRTRRPSRKRPRYRTDAELMDAARVADLRHRDRHGRPITRDALRAALRISGPRATELRRRLAASAPAVPVPDAKEVANQR